MPAASSSAMDEAAEGDRLYAELYDLTEVGWPGELEAYERWSREVAEGGVPRVLEIASGTGRVALALAARGIEVVGIDHSAAMVAVAAAKAGGSARFVEADMAGFDLGQAFDAVLVPAHAFQYMGTAHDQLAALSAFRRHLRPRGRLVVHLDRPELDWLASLPADPPPVREAGGVLRHRSSGGRHRFEHAWTWDGATEVATIHTAVAELGADGETVLRRLEREPRHLKVIFRVEMEHALGRAGFSVEALYGDFDGSPMTAASQSAIWLARRS
jgi:SAM-dependent methyltransferase